MSKTPKEMEEIILGQFLDDAGGDGEIQRIVDNQDQCIYREKWRLKELLKKALVSYNDYKQSLPN